MPSRVIEVNWEIALDERFRLVVRRGTAFARPESGNSSVHVDVGGLLPGRGYFYRFSAEGTFLGLVARARRWGLGRRRSRARWDVLGQQVFFSKLDFTPGADVHAAWAAEVEERWNDPTSRTVATELVSTSITSGGDGSEVRPETPAILAENPHVKYFNNRRGYVRTKITAREVRADFRGLDYVRTPGAPVSTKASFVIDDREPGLNRA